MFTNFSAVVLGCIIKEKKILLIKRKNTPRWDGHWALPWGRLDEGERFTIGAIREIKEEVWIEVNREDIWFQTIIQHKDELGERIYFSILVEKYIGNETNMECEWCEEIGWFSLDALPSPITPQVHMILHNMQNKIPYSESGYEK